MTDRLEVSHESRRIGTLARAAGSPEAIAFTYDPGWLARPDAFPLSTRMPLTVEPFPPATAYPWFLNLLPEGDDLPLVGRNLGLSRVDVLAILGRLGRDLAGAIEVATDADGTRAESPRYRRLDAAELAGAIRRLPERPLLAGEEGVRMSLAGNQSKLPVAKVAGGGLALPLAGAASTHILKPAIRRLRGSVENEAFCLALAAAVGLEAAAAETGIADGEKYLLVRRYDRVPVERRVARLHQEDLCQACGRPPYLKYEADHGYGSGPGLADCFAVLDAHSTQRARDRLALRDAVIFNLLTGNVDAHAKNFSLLLLPGGAVRLAPLYDLMCGGIYPGVTRNMAMRIAGQNRGDQVRRRHWDRLAGTVGLSASSLRARVAELAGLLPGLAARTAAAMRAEHLDRAVLDEVAAAVTARCARVLANLAPDAA